MVSRVNLRMALRMFYLTEQADLPLDAKPEENADEAEA